MLRLYRKIAYITAIALLLLPIAALSQPAAVDPQQPGGGSPGGKLVATAHASTTWPRPNWARSIRPAKR